MSDLVKIARVRVGTERTHWVGCERDHTECLIQRLADEIERLRTDVTTFMKAANEEAAEVERLRAERDALQVNAARYRLLRDVLPVEAVEEAIAERDRWGGASRPDEAESAKVDAFIDAQIEKETNND
jgi:hypothetical protein